MVTTSDGMSGLVVDAAGLVFGLVAGGTIALVFTVVDDLVEDGSSGIG